MYNSGNKKYFSRNIFLDILRSAACLLVFATHIVRTTGFEVRIPSLQMLLEKVCYAGANGVVLLFVLSGYLGWISIQKKDTVTYWGERALRLIPIYYIVLFLYLVLGILPKNVGVLRYFTFTNAVIPSDEYNIYNNMGGFWTMSSFALFYFIVPLLKKFIVNIKTAFAGTILMFVMGKAFDIVLQYIEYAGITEMSSMTAIFPIGNMYFFFIGVVAYYAIADHKAEAVEVFGLLGISLMAMIGKIDYPFWALITLCIIILSAKIQYTDIPKWITGVIVRMSEFSFEIYLLHLLILQIIMQTNWEGNTQTIMAIILTFLFAWMLHGVNIIITEKLRCILMRRAIEVRKK